MTRVINWFFIGLSYLLLGLVRIIDFFVPEEELQITMYDIKDDKNVSWQLTCDICAEKYEANYEEVHNQYYYDGERLCPNCMQALLVLGEENK